MDTIQTIVADTKLKLSQVNNVINLLSEGNTIPFIARYRKEVTENLDEVELRVIRDRYEYLTELEDRKAVILKTIDEQGKLTDELKQKIENAEVKQLLEDLYLPFKPKKRTRATIAREMGLEPLAELMRDQQDYESWLEAYLKNSEEEITETEVRQRARDIIAEWVAEDAEIKEKIRDICWKTGSIKSDVQKEFATQHSKFEMYYDYSEAIAVIPAHRYLAIRRGEEESVIRLKFEFPVEAILNIIEEKWGGSSAKQTEDLKMAIEDAYQRLLAPSIEVEIRVMLKAKSDEDSISVFSKNLRDLLLAPMGGTKMVLGLDPGFKSGTKWVVVDETGKFHEKGVIYPTQPYNKVAQARKDLKAALAKYPCDYFCIGNGTASREISLFVREFLKEEGITTVQSVIVNESGASIYSASEVAREEFPDLDLSFRGSISIARRFQDPLAELVKIDPKSIGVGQYQHDVNQKRLKKSLDEAVESCVNFVGVNLNTASVSLLSYVSGMNKTLAKNVVTYRNENGAFKERKDLIKVQRFGPKSFQQSAGFLRIQGGTDPLDQSAVHPENYPIVLKMAEDLQTPLGELIGNDSKLSTLDLAKYKSETVGYLTLKDIIDELKKPGRDPRKTYVGAKLEDEITTIGDLLAGMQLEGTVTNLTKFGAFVDIGVHHDGLVHLSEMSDRFIKDPSEVCNVGEVVKVKVINVDKERKRIALSMKSQPGQGQAKAKRSTAPKPDTPHPKLTGKIDVDINSLAEKFKSM